MEERTGMFVVATFQLLTYPFAFNIVGDIVFTP